MDEKTLRRIIREELLLLLKQENDNFPSNEEWESKRKFPPRRNRFERNLYKFEEITHRLWDISKIFEDWADECECKYSENDIEYIKNAVDNLNKP